MYASRSSSRDIVQSLDLSVFSSSKFDSGTIFNVADVDVVYDVAVHLRTLDFIESSNVSQRGEQPALEPL